MHGSIKTLGSCLRRAASFTVTAMDFDSTSRAPYIHTRNTSTVAKLSVQREGRGAKA